MSEGVAQQRISALEAELAGLRAIAAERDTLSVMVGELREANQNLLQATLSAQTLRDDAEATNRNQNEFLAMLAHELRNPLAPISMAATLMALIPEAPEQLLRLQKIVERQVAHLARLLDDLLDAARISGGKISVLLQPVLLNEVLERSVETVQTRIDERHQQMTLDLPLERLIIEGDQVRLAQVFSNLLVNASKFTHDGGTITLAARVDGERVVITMQDNGAGITAEMMPLIFNLFAQAPRSMARSEGGLGVGLSVVRNVVEMHGGTVEAGSPGLGSGSIFTVTLPLSARPIPVSPLTSRGMPAAAGYRILLVEDNRDASDTLRSFLALEGHTVDVAYDGLVGLAMAMNEAYDVLICDIGLPSLNGLELIRELRSSASSHIPFAVAVSGYGQPEDRSRAIGAGFGHYFVKPLDVDAMLALMASDAVSKLVVRP